MNKGPLDRALGPVNRATRTLICAWVTLAAAGVIARATWLCFKRAGMAPIDLDEAEHILWLAVAVCTLFGAIVGWRKRHDPTVTQLP